MIQEERKLLLFLAGVVSALAPSKNDEIDNRVRDLMRAWHKHEVEQQKIKLREPA